MERDKLAHFVASPSSGIFFSVMTEKEKNPQRIQPLETCASYDGNTGKNQGKTAAKLNLEFLNKKIKFLLK